MSLATEQTASIQTKIQPFTAKLKGRVSPGVETLLILFGLGYMLKLFPNLYFIGFLGIIFSFNKGLLFFTPGIFLPIKKYILGLEQEGKEKLFSAYTLWISFVVGLILIYSAWWAWDGALFWGPRFFLIACIPASFALAVRLHRPGKSLLANLLTLIAFVWSLCVGIDGAVFDLNDLSQFCVVGHYQNMPLCQYDPHYSALWRPIANHSALGRSSAIFVLYSLVVFIYLTAPLMITMARQTKDVYGAILKSLHTKALKF